MSKKKAKPSPRAHVNMIIAKALQDIDDAALPYVQDLERRLQAARNQDETEELGYLTEVLVRTRVYLATQKTKAEINISRMFSNLIAPAISEAGVKLPPVDEEKIEPDLASVPLTSADNDTESE